MGLSVPLRCRTATFADGIANPAGPSEHDGGPGVRRGRLSGQDENPRPDDRPPNTEHDELSGPEDPFERALAGPDPLHLYLFDRLGREDDMPHTLAERDEESIESLVRWA